MVWLNHIKLSLPPKIYYHAVLLKYALLIRRIPVADGISAVHIKDDDSLRV